MTIKELQKEKRDYLRFFMNTLQGEGFDRLLELLSIEKKLAMKGVK